MPTTQHKALVPLNELPVMENGDMQLNEINISDIPERPLLLNIILKKALDNEHPCRRSIEIECGKWKLFLNSEDTSRNGLIKYSYEYNSDDANPLLNTEGNITDFTSIFSHNYHINSYLAKIKCKM